MQIKSEMKMYITLYVLISVEMYYTYVVYMMANSAIYSFIYFFILFWFGLRFGCLTRETI